jgi:hypothetical protein
MTVPVEERVEYKRDEFFQYYNNWCYWLEIPEEARCQSINEFSKELVNTCKVKEVDVKDTNSGVKKRYYVFRMCRKYDSTRLNSPVDGDIKNSEQRDL